MDVTIRFIDGTSRVYNIGEVPKQIRGCSSALYHHIMLNLNMLNINIEEITMIMSWETSKPFNEYH